MKRLRRVTPVLKGKGCWEGDESDRKVNELSVGRKNPEALMLH